MENPDVSKSKKSNGTYGNQISITSPLPNKHIYANGMQPLVVYGTVTQTNLQNVTVTIETHSGTVTLDGHGNWSASFSFSNTYANATLRATATYSDMTTISATEPEQVN